MRRIRGGMLIELLVTLVILMIIGAGVFQYFVSANIGNESVMSGNAAITYARQPVDIVADHIRNAQQYTSNGGVTYSVIHAAGPTSITYYGTEAGAQVTYALSGSTLQRTDAGGTTDVLTNISSLNFRYFLAPGSTVYYSSVALVEGDPATFTLTERSRIAVVELSGSVVVNGYPRSFKTEIRLRNSPRKQRL